MKKKIIILALILVSGMSLLRSQPIKGIKAADMNPQGFDYAHWTEIVCKRSGDSLVFSANSIRIDTFQGTDIMIRIKFTGNTRKEFNSMWFDETSLGLKLVDETSGRSFDLKPDRNGDFNITAELGEYGIVTHELTHYKFMLNGKVIATGYKPQIPVTGLKSADMKLIKSTGIEFSFSREGNKLVVLAKSLGVTYEDVHVDKEVVARLKFTGNSRQEFETFAPGAMPGQLKLEMVNKSTGRSIELKPGKNGEYHASADQDWEEFQVTFNEFKLNGKIIGVEYIPGRN